ncbi:hypothetical protein [Natronobiforma cellulositropha]|uniref:hypothetical protein n=1 Tax=Natronobiforma cellulositropha TaxID=1679076 RepID=UPI0021D59FA3|nr:hypothetical protein [Natronobiforma cellulositropha]
MAGGSLTTLLAEVRAHPIAATLELGSVVGCALLFLATLAALASGPPTLNEWLWVAIVAGGAVLAVLWTFVVPLYEHYLYPRLS